MSVSRLAAEPWERERLSCDNCGRFATEVEWEGPWGGAGDDEPPDPVALCPRCVARDEAAYLAWLLRHGIPPHERRSVWSPAPYYYRARDIARAMFRHGTRRPVRHERVRYATGGTTEVWSCGNCGRPERHPAHDLREVRRLSLTWCQFVRGVGRNIGTFVVQEWCACGWTTGALPPGRGHPRPVDYLGAGTLIRAHVAEATAVDREGTGR